MEDITLLNGNILVEVSETTQTESGFLLSRDAVRLPQTGVVKSVSSDIKEVKAGDRVQFLRYAALDTDDDNIKVCKLKHILGVYNGTKD